MLEKGISYAELLAALEEFNLPQRASLRAIRERYRQLVRRYHPDCAQGDDPERIMRINSAYAILNDYIGQYQFDFSRQAFYDRYPEERLREQFYGENLWQGK
jgi:curved DNA-binding protein CbpA